MSDKIISIVLTTVGKRKCIFNAIESINCQTMLPAELVVVNDSNIDTSIEIRNKLCSKIVLKYHINGSNKGANYSRNIGCNKADSEIILFLDDDDIFYCEKVEQVVAKYKKEKFDVVYHPAEIIYNDLRCSYISAPAGNVNFNKLLIKNYVGATSMVGVKKEIIQKIGSIFDENLPALQDWDAWIYLSKQDAKFVYIKNPLTKYIVNFGDFSTSKNIDKHIFAEYVLYEKYKENIDKLSSREKILRDRYLSHVKVWKNLLARTKRIKIIQMVAREFVKNYDFQILKLFIIIIFGLKLSIRMRSLKCHFL